MDIYDLINNIKQLSDCNLLSPDGLPAVRDPHILPSDLRAFYAVCGGAVLFKNAVFPMEIVTPKQFTLANPVIFARVNKEHLTRIEDDISWSWYIIGCGLNSQYITIDLSLERSGLCYDSKWDRHPRDSFIIARSFTDLLLGLLSTRGEYDYWDDLGLTLGSPYDLSAD